MIDWVYITVKTGTISFQLAFLLHIIKGQVFCNQLIVRFKAFNAGSLSSEMQAWIFKIIIASN